MRIGSQTDKQANEAFCQFSKAVCKRYGEKPFTAAGITNEVPEAKKDREAVNRWIGRAMSSGDITHAREQPPGTFCFASAALKLLRRVQPSAAAEEKPVEVQSIMPPPVEAPSKNPENCQDGTLGDTAEVQEFFVLLIYRMMGVGLLDVESLRKAVMSFCGWEKITPEVFEQILKRLVALFVLEKKGGTYGLSGPSAVKYVGMAESFARELKMRFPPVAAAVYLSTPLVPEPVPVPVPDPEPPRPPVRVPRLVIVEPPPAPPVEEPVTPAEDTTAANEVCKKQLGLAEAEIARLKMVESERDRLKQQVDTANKAHNFDMAKLEGINDEQKGRIAKLASEAAELRTVIENLKKVAVQKSDKQATSSPEPDVDKALLESANQMLTKRIFAAEVRLNKAERALRKAERRSGQLGIVLITNGLQQLRHVFAGQEIDPSVFENLKGKIENQRRYLKSAEARQIWKILQGYPREFWWVIVLLFKSS